MRIRLVIASITACLGIAAAQTPNQLSKDTKSVQDTVKTNITKSAAKMPEDQFSFRPTPEVRSFGQLLGHIADSQYMFCSAAKGEAAPQKNVEKTKTSKADLIAALDEAFAYCDGVYGSMSDAKALETVKFFGGDRTRANVLAFNTSHNYEHYGNIVTYMRMKGLVPPSSEGR